MDDNFAIFITTHGRPQCLTYHTLRNAGYTGRMFCVVDNEDDTVDEYRKNYGEENVLVFDKYAVSQRVDKLTNEYMKSVVLYSRIACYDFAHRLDVDYFISIDDDVTLFKLRMIVDDKLKSIPVTDADAVLGAMLEFFKTTPLYALGIADAGIYFGGKSGVWSQCIRQSFSVGCFLKTHEPIEFGSVFNEDIYTSVNANREGKTCFELLDICQESDSQGTGDSGGMVDFYRTHKKVVRSFYTVIAFPDFATMNERGDLRFNRLCMTPKIISCKYKK